MNVLIRCVLISMLLIIRYFCYRYLLLVQVNRKEIMLCVVAFRWLFVKDNTDVVLRTDLLSTIFESSAADVA